ncbi:MAG: type III-A CRISPR-associated RAMP protein Csm3 [Planctomycetes bacterium]|nr:type III-A CRISPR-associated RAMP protein Csm3 [Planctomycetota bacterium]
MKSRLTGKIFIRGFIEIMTGTSIGGAGSAFAYTGLDKTIVRNPITLEPYIPASSLKGKMRALMEKSAGEYSSHGRSFAGPIQTLEPQTEIGKSVVALFGAPADPKARKFNQARLSVSDGLLENAEFIDTRGVGLDLPYAEVKAEVSLDRVTSQTAGTLRHIERVPAGAVFSIDWILSLYTIDGRQDSAKDLLESIFFALAMIEDDFIGSSGTRGYGRVKFHLLPLLHKSVDDYRTGGGLTAFTRVEIPKQLSACKDSLALLGVDADKALEHHLRNVKVKESARPQAQEDHSADEKDEPAEAAEETPEAPAEATPTESTEAEGAAEAENAEKKDEPSAES